MAIKRVDATRESYLQRLAALVEADLRLVGLPTSNRGDCWKGGRSSLSGAIVFYDPSADDSGGVYVEWKPSLGLLQEALRSGALDSREAVVGGAALDAMLNAMKVILVAAGWMVQSDRTGVHESVIKVDRRELESDT